ncbi:hypothetical protein HU200_006931 [Digitaria exilis]|uniref:Uncharacterized protein n=1 Tax=Digitaria exilis TaxID=1010633 RepID=A0A835FQH1_9POAL|nr:hypothetical protein HU200_006931 [Digitaria exilis]
MMGRHHRSRSASASSAATRSDTTELEFASADLDPPFGSVDALGPVELRETAYEIFFMSCRSSGAAPPITTRGADAGEVSSPMAGGARGGGAGPTAGVTGSSRVKKSLGLRARRLSQPMMARTLSQTSGPASPGRARRPMTSAEIMRQQMRVTEQSDARLRRTLMRTVVGQVGRRPDTIVLPLELLRQLKPAEFADAEEYHQWQFRQVKLLEAGLILHPSLPLDRLHAPVLRFREVMRATEIRAIDTGKGSEVMRALTTVVHALSWRSGTAGAAVEACHWADGYPLNVLLYCSLLQAIFDLRECTVVLDEVDELLELIKKTWPTLGVTRAVHNVCLAWVLFQQYVITGQVEPDLAAAALAVLVDVTADARQQESSRDPLYVKVLLSALGGMQEWFEKRLLDYHEGYEKGVGGAATEGVEILLSLALAAGKIIADREGAGEGNFAGDRVDYYIRCSMKSAFTKILENGLGEAESVMIIERDNDPGSVLMQLARDTEQLATFERRNFSPVLRRWHPAPVAVAAVTLHGCFGVVLRQYLAKVTILTDELVRVLHSASRLEKALAQMTAEDAADCHDGRAKAIVGDMEPFEVESVVMGLLKAWMDDKLGLAKDCVLRARDTEVLVRSTQTNLDTSWIPKSKEDPFAASAMELMKLARFTIDEFSEIPASAKDEVVHDLVDGLEAIFHDYISFVASCGTKQSYLPPLPPLTRCNQDSGFFRLWKKAALPTCQAPPEGSPRGGVGGSQHIPRPSISRGTQRLYVRLNTLHYVLTHLHALSASLSSASVFFDRARAAAQASVPAVAEVAAHRLVFLDSRHSFYQGLYAGRGGGGAGPTPRIRPALRQLKQNLTFLVSVLADRAQPVAVREVMRASFEAFVMVLLAGGNERSFARGDHAAVEEDFISLKRAFCTCGEGLVPEEVVEREAATAEAVVELMARSTECLIDAFSVAACESIGAGEEDEEDGGGGGGGTPLPPTTRKWDPADPNTILRVLCHRDDEAASQFLKRTFQLARRR